MHRRELDNIFVDRFVAVRCIVSFHGETVADLQAGLEQAMKDCPFDFREQRDDLGFRRGAFVEIKDGD